MPGKGRDRSSQRSKTGITLSHRPCCFLRSPVGDAQELQELLLDQLRASRRTRPRLQPPAASPPPGRSSASPQPARLDQRRAELREQRCPSRCVEDEQIRRSFEEADRRGQVAARERPSTCRLEPLGRPGRERGRVRVDRPDRGAATVRLLEVVTDDRLELAQPLPGRALEPPGEALVQVGAACSSRATGTRRRGSARAGTGTPRRPRNPPKSGRITSRRTRAIRVALESRRRARRE